MLYYLRLIWLFLKLEIQKETAFHLDFAINIMNTVLAVLTSVLGLYILFDRVNTLRGWTFAQTLALLGVFLLVSALRDLVIEPNMSALGGMNGEIWTGRFDYTMIKPLNKQFFVSFRYWHIWSLIDMVIGATILGVAVHQLLQRITAIQVTGFVCALLISLLILYSSLLLLASLSLWFHGLPTLWIFDSFLQTGRYPVGIYPGWLQLVLTWIVPVGFITTVPVQTLSGQTSPWTTLIGGIFALALFGIASLVFQRSLHRYSSASS